jgi:hypothetical protein
MNSSLVKLDKTNGEMKILTIDQVREMVGHNMPSTLDGKVDLFKNAERIHANIFSIQAVILEAMRKQVKDMGQEPGKADEMLLSMGVRQKDIDFLDQILVGIDPDFLMITSRSLSAKLLLKGNPRLDKKSQQVHLNNQEVFAPKIVKGPKGKLEVKLIQDKIMDLEPYQQAAIVRNGKLITDKNELLKIGEGIKKQMEINQKEKSRAWGWRGTHWYIGNETFSPERMLAMMLDYIRGLKPILLNRPSVKRLQKLVANLQNFIQKNQILKSE